MTAQRGRHGDYDSGQPRSAEEAAIHVIDENDEVVEVELEDVVDDVFEVDEA